MYDSGMPDCGQKRRCERRRKNWMRLFVFCAASLLGLIALDFAVRWRFPYFMPGRPLLQKNEEGVVLGIPSQTLRLSTPKGDYDVTMRYNRYGFRDAKDIVQSTSNDVFVAGDSFSGGWCVEETERYSNLLEQTFGVPFFNIASPEDIRGYIAIVRYAERHGAKIRNLIIGLCMENDLWDYTQPVSNHDLFAQQMNRGAMRKVWNWFKTHSAIWNFSSFHIQRSRTGRALFEKFGIAKDVEALTHPNDYSPKTLTATRDELLKLATNYNSVVLIIPSRGLWYGRNVSTEKRMHDEMVGLLRDAGVKVLDMRPVLERTAHPLQHYFANDPHWNVAGHKAAAEELARFLPMQAEWNPVLSRRKLATP